MATTTISLPDDQLARLKRYADASGRSLDDVVSEAAANYLECSSAPNGKTREQERDHLAPGWSPTFRVGADGMRVAIPPAMSPTEVDEFLAAPSPSARRDYLRVWLQGRGATVIELPPGPPSSEWQARFDTALASIRARVPSDMSPDELEALITEVSEEARQERIARRERTGE